MIDDRIRDCPNCGTDFHVRAVVISANCRKYECRRCGRSWSQGHEPPPSNVYISGRVNDGIGQSAPSSPARTLHPVREYRKDRLGHSRKRFRDEEEEAA
jgi:predicted Zn finger-like uncharacterized protein